MNAMASQITDVSIVCSSVCSGADQRKHQSSSSLAFVRGIHRWPVDSAQTGLVTRKMFSFGNVIMLQYFLALNNHSFIHTPVQIWHLCLQMFKQLTVLGHHELETPSLLVHFRYSNFTSALRRLKSLTTPLFVFQLIKANIKKLSQLCFIVHLWGETTGGRRFPSQWPNSGEDISMARRHQIKRHHLTSWLDLVINECSTRVDIYSYLLLVGSFLQIIQLTLCNYF